MENVIIVQKELKEFMNDIMSLTKNNFWIIQNFDKAEKYFHLATQYIFQLFSQQNIMNNNKQVTYQKQSNNYNYYYVTETYEGTSILK